MNISVLEYAAAHDTGGDREGRRISCVASEAVREIRREPGGDVRFLEVGLAKSVLSHWSKEYGGQAPTPEQACEAILQAIREVPLLLDHLDLADDDEREVTSAPVPLTGR